MYDHKMNNFISRAIGIALLLHQIAACYFLNVEDIFPGELLSKGTKQIIYGVMALVVLFVILLPKWKSCSSDIINFVVATAI